MVVLTRSKKRRCREDEALGRDFAGLQDSELGSNKAGRGEEEKKETNGDSLFDCVIIEVGDVIFQKVLGNNADVRCGSYVEKHYDTLVHLCRVLLSSRRLLSREQIASVLGGCVEICDRKRSELLSLAKSASLAGRSAKKVWELKEALMPLELVSPEMFKVFETKRRERRINAVCSIGARGIVDDGENPLWMEMLIKEYCGEAEIVYKTQAHKYFRLPDGVLQKVHHYRGWITMTSYRGSFNQETFEYRAKLLAYVARMYHTIDGVRERIPYDEGKAVQECDNIRRSFRKESEFVTQVWERYHALEEIWSDEGFSSSLDAVLSGGTYVGEGMQFGARGVTWEYLAGKETLESLVSLHRAMVQYGVSSESEGKKLLGKIQRSEDLKKVWLSEGYEDAELLSHDLDEEMRTRYPISWNYINLGFQGYDSQVRSREKALEARALMCWYAASTEDEAVRTHCRSLERKSFEKAIPHILRSRLSMWKNDASLSMGPDWKASLDSLCVPQTEESLRSTHPIISDMTVSSKARNAHFLPNGKSKCRLEAALDLYILCHFHTLSEREFLERLINSDLSLLFKKNHLYECACGYYSGQEKMIRHLSATNICFVMSFIRNSLHQGNAS